MIGGTLHRFRRYSRVCVISPLFPFPELYRVRGGYVPDWPRNDEVKPVFKFVGGFAHLRPPTDRWDTLRIEAAQQVLVRRTLEGPDFTPNYGGARNRALVRIEPYHKPLPADAAILAVFKADDPLLNFWRGVAAAGARDEQDRVEILVETPSWRVVLLPLEAVRRGLLESLALSGRTAITAPVAAGRPTREAVGTARRVL